MRPLKGCVVGPVLALLLGMDAEVAFAQIAFTDVTDSAGMTHSSESYGASWGDLNGDGLLDLYASNHRTRDSLFLARGDGTFLDVADWQNRPNADTHGGTWADFDNDGDQDLMISTGSGASELLVNENQRLVDRTVQFGLGVSNLDGRLPVWLDYDKDHLLDIVVAQYGGAARLHHQLPGGGFTDTTKAATLLCVHFQYAQLLDVNGDGHLDILCPDENRFPQKIYDPTTFPWTQLFDRAHPSSLFPVIDNVVDSAIADFNNDGRMDLFVLGGVQLRPSSVVQSGPYRFESLLAGGSKGFEFVTTGLVAVNVDWNNAAESGSTDPTKIQIGRAARHPTTAAFSLDPADPTAVGLPPLPNNPSALPAMQIGLDPVAKRWTVRIITKLNSLSPQAFSQAYFQVTSTAPITGLVATGLWPTDKPARPTLLMNRAGSFADETAAAGLDTPVQCASVTAGDFDNDMYVDLYLACRTGASNIPNILYHNDGNGTFTVVPDAGGAAGPLGLAISDHAGTADSVLTGDYDVDGFLDLFVSNGFNLRPIYVGGPNKLYRNNGNGNHWIELDLVGVNSDRDATGAAVYATANGVTQFRVQDGRYHRWSQDAKRIHFGLAGSATVGLTIKWPSGAVQSFPSVPADKLFRITEGVTIPFPIDIGGSTGHRCELGLVASLVDTSELAGTVKVAVRRTGGSSGAVSVDYATAAGSAVSGSDYTATAGTLSWADGDTTDKSITIAIAADTSIEASESFTLNLTNPSGGADLATSQIEIQILDESVSTPPASSPPPSTPRAASPGGGGAIGWETLIILTFALLGHIRRQRVGASVRGR